MLWGAGGGAGARQGPLAPIRAHFDEQGANASSWYLSGVRSHRDEIMRDLRLAVLAGDLKALDQLLAERAENRKLRDVPVLGLMALNGFDGDWLNELPRTLQLAMCADAVWFEAWGLGTQSPVAGHLAALAPRPAEGWTGEPGKPSPWSALALWRLLAGELIEARLPDGADALARVDADAQAGMARALRGERDAAIETFTDALGHYRKATRKRKLVLPGLPGIIHLLALLGRGRSADMNLAGRMASDGMDLCAGHVGHVYDGLLDLHLDLTSAAEDLATDPEHGRGASWEPELDDDGREPQVGLRHVLQTMILSWSRIDLARAQVPALLEAARRAAAGGHRWAEAEALELLAQLDAAPMPAAEPPAEMRQALGLVTLCDTVKRSEPWERTLKGLLMVADAAREPRGEAVEQRLAWFLGIAPGGDGCELEPRVQRRGKGGRWTKGKRLSFKQLSEGREELEFLLDQDRRAASCISNLDPLGYRGRYSFDALEVIVILAGHPHVFWADAPGRRVELISAEPELLVASAGEELRLSMLPPREGPDLDSQLGALERRLSEHYAGADGALSPAELDRLHEQIERVERQLDRREGDSGEVLLTREGADRVRITRFGPAHRRVAQLLGPDGLVVPAAGKERVLEAVAALAPMMPVQSDIGSGGGVAVDEVEAESRTVAICAPLAAGIMVELMVRPLGEGGALYRPGQGGATVLAEVDGRRLQATRDLEDEQERMGKVLSACPALARAEQRDGAHELPEAADGLQALLELGELGDEVQLVWPRGEPIVVRGRSSTDQLSLRIRKRRQWFEADGELRVDDHLVLDLRRLLELAGEHRGSFIPLGKGQFLALTRKLRRRLDELAAFTTARATGARLSPLAVPALEGLVQEVGALDADRHFDAQLRRMRDAWALEPTLPSTLRGTLREYQQQGFRWLVRLAAWGVGGCLADDMGLGKTIQALALILARAGGGPSLVVAPTSVRLNWQREAARFAPTLQVKVFGPGDRGAMVAALGPRDVLLCSYGLLVREAELLQGVSWHTVVLDEAQAIKNPSTKRAQAVMKLEATMRLATTGTPMENHLLELWTLFKFLNPGLLGSRQDFTRRYARPIEREGDQAVRRQLKRLIRPFILRRTKDQVLEELPERTEVLRHVVAGDAEAALYEALRRDAVERLDQQGDAPAGERNVQVLAELMRLRRACCNPRLVAPECGVLGAKLEALDELLDELLPGGHKALVFSQFVGHLQLIREHLEARGVKYQYLDGATPEAERRRRVDAFQLGAGDLFLISLRAGGLGLNLTAADFVIHMDPWWNPAVEDQASDRAHRIGQVRPVTIYRLVLQGTIEDKIVALHREKRGLVRDILDGTERASRLSADQLVALLRSNE